MAVENEQPESESNVVSLDSQGILNVRREFGVANAGRHVRFAIDLVPPESQFRGSREHVLGLLDSPNWPNTLEKIIGLQDVRVADEPHPIPIGHSSVAETDIDEYVRRYCGKEWPGADKELAQGKWWAPNGGTRPQMDLICRITQGGKDGLLFIEAKAHEGELDWGGKPLAMDASEGSMQNHENIRQQIAKANTELNALCGTGFNLSLNSHYQLVNRLTYLWKLASIGVPVVLMYLGFTSDKYFENDYLRDDHHWQRIMGGYMQGVAPHGFPERGYSLTNGASLKMLVRSCCINTLSTK